ncbi:type II toxin-antitoxin system VapC family toxin [Microbacterium sp.]|uniref:type II toxin-antitoxin system VapC family toxin n=1 Tax=Microbacterium sp. TaxID=51671 RepID=UPI003A8E610D
MRRIVDASALVDAVLPTTRRDAAHAALAGHELWAPAILDLEVMSALWRLVRMGEITPDEAERGIALLRTAPVHRLDDAAVAVEAWTLRESLRLSDAFYVAAARLLDADLLTSDARLSRAPALGVTVVLLR